MTSDFEALRRGVGVMACAALMTLSGSQLAIASSGDAWAEFERDVQAACLAEASGLMTVNNIFVDPYGSESYGFAVMVGIGVGTTTGYMVVCAYDKLTQVAEVSGLFDL